MTIARWSHSSHPEQDSENASAPMIVAGSRVKVGHRQALTAKTPQPIGRAFLFVPPDRHTQRLCQALQPAARKAGISIPCPFKEMCFASCDGSLPPVAGALPAYGINGLGVALGVLLRTAPGGSVRRNPGRLLASGGADLCQPCGYNPIRPNDMAPAWSLAASVVSC